MINHLMPPDAERLNNYIESMQRRAASSIGYPGSTDYDYSALFPLLGINLNNIGDPLIESTYELNSRSFELEVVEFFAELFQAPANNWWGYVTNGGSEGNLYGLYAARELYPNGIVYYSDATHYSIQKNVHILGLNSIVIRTQPNGEMDYEDLSDMIQLHRDHPVIIMANIGTTMTEARDNLGQIKAALKHLAVKQHYIHCDAALAGVYSALLQTEPRFDFSRGCDSIAISGHKFLGSPIPCGAVIVRKNYKDRIGQVIPYIGTADTTISGSRNGHSPVFLWYTLKKHGKEGLTKRAQNSLALAQYTRDRLREFGLDAWCNPGALTVVSPVLPARLRKKWQLATEGDICHIVCVPGVTRTMIDDFLADVQTELKTPKVQL
jgi:histidine decarboxylase